MNNLIDLLSIPLKNRRKQRALVAGWFSYSDRKATFGDTTAKDVVCGWLTDEGIPFDVAGNPNNRVMGIDIERVNPKRYSIFIFVCGPWQFDPSILDRYKHCVKIGINLSLLRDENEGFDFIIPRDAPSVRNPDVVFAASTQLVPVVGVILVHPQPLYGDRQRHKNVQRILDRFISNGKVAPIFLDTKLIDNNGLLKNLDQFESLIRRTDFVISTRLHGMVFSIKNRIPVIAIDPIAGGEKITKQAETLGWPLILNGDNLRLENLEKYAELCLSGAMMADVERCRMKAEKEVVHVKDNFLEYVRGLTLDREKLMK